MKKLILVLLLNSCCYVSVKPGKLQEWEDNWMIKCTYNYPPTEIESWTDFIKLEK